MRMEWAEGENDPKFSCEGRFPSFSMVHFNLHGFESRLNEACGPFLLRVFVVMMEQSELSCAERCEAWSRSDLKFRRYLMPGITLICDGSKDTLCSIQNPRNNSWE